MKKNKNVKKSKELKEIEIKELKADLQKLMDVLHINDDYKEKLKQEIKAEVIREVMTVLRVDVMVFDKLNQIHEKEGMKAYV